MKRKKSRFIYMILAGIGISFLLNLLMAKANVKTVNPSFHILTSVIITIMVWEGNLWIDHWINKIFPWLTKPGKRIAFQLPISMVYSACAIYLSLLTFNTFVCQLPVHMHDAFMKTSVVIGLMVSITILSAEIGTQFFVLWKKSLVEVEKYKTESLQSQLQNLKNQVNPHFLFNNLSVLSSLVYEDQDKAVDFINQLSKVYRYLLDNRSSELVSLEKELTFINSYTYLFKIRFDRSIVFDIDIESNCTKKLIPPMALQLLIENAIKHNEVSTAKPLTVRIRCAGDYLIVENTLQSRSFVEESTGTGLNNIRSRYSYFTDKHVLIEDTNNKFIVKIPLLQES